MELGTFTLCSSVTLTKAFVCK